MYSRFSLFNTACDLSQNFWKDLLKPGDSVIDATVGNGHDTLFLANILLKKMDGQLFGFDIQETAINNTWEQLKEAFNEDELKNVTLFHESHDQMERLIKVAPKLIVYNLGYLPGATKDVTTLVASTLLSVQQGMQMLAPGGALSIVCYPGHLEGEKEEEALLDFFKEKDPRIWSISYFKLLNRKKSPSLILVQKAI